MKSEILKYCCLPGIILIAFTGMLMAQDETGFRASASVDYFNRFVWRGQNQNNDSVIQGNVEGKTGGFTGGIWFNVPVTDTYGTKTAGAIDEVDFSIDFSRNISDWNVGYSLGAIHYMFTKNSPADLRPTTEIYGGLNFNIPLSPSVKWYRDVDEIHGSYIQFGVGHTFERIGNWSDNEYVSLDLKAAFGLGGPGYNAGYFGNYGEDPADPTKTKLLNPDIEELKFNDFTLNVAVPFNLKHGISIAPSFNVSTMLSESIRDYCKKNDDKNGTHTQSSTNIWFGINFTKSF